MAEASDTYVDLKPLLMSIARLTARDASLTPEGLEILLAAADLKASESSRAGLMKIANHLQASRRARDGEERLQVCYALAGMGLDTSLIMDLVETVVEGVTIPAFQSSGSTGPTLSNSSTPESSNPARTTYDLLVDPSGRGTHTSLTQILLQAPPGATIGLSAGTHRLDIEEGRMLTSPVTLVGQGREATQIVLPSGPLVYGESGSFGLRDLSVGWDSESSSSDNYLMMVGADEIHFERCRFVGGRAIALLVIGNTTGVIRDCIFENSQMGIGTGQDVKLTIEGNTFRNNDLAGLGFQDNVSGTARNNTCTGNKVGIFLQGDAAPDLVDNTCSENTEHGIRVRGSAHPTLVGNRCDHNGDCGVEFNENSGGEVRGCTASNNGSSGVGATADARLTVQSNTCNSNGHAGILFGGSTAGDISGNTCRDNIIGIAASDRATPAITSNQCRGGTVGIGVLQSAKVTIEGNTCTSCEQAGIQAGDDAVATVVDNTCQENPGLGIGYFGRARGTARTNTVQKNGMGLYLDEECAPLVENNLVSGSVYSGCVCYQTSRPTIQSNTFRSNGKHGIFVRDEAQPVIENNTCTDNTEDGIHFSPRTGGQIDHNRCTGNHGFGIVLEEGATPLIGDNTLDDNSGGKILDSRRRRGPFGR